MDGNQVLLVVPVVISIVSCILMRERKKEREHNTKTYRELDMRWRRQ